MTVSTDIPGTVWELPYHEDPYPTFSEDDRTAIVAWAAEHGLDANRVSAKGCKIIRTDEGDVLLYREWERGHLGVRSVGPDGKFTTIERRTPLVAPPPPLPGIADYMPPADG